LVRHFTKRTNHVILNEANAILVVKKGVNLIGIKAPSLKKPPLLRGGAKRSLCPFAMNFTKESSFIFCKDSDKKNSVLFFKEMNGNGSAISPKKF
jgi:hypothetical protein